MQASELIYCNKSQKRVLLISHDYKLQSELEGILSQIQMPDSILATNEQKYAIELSEQYEPHAILLDSKVEHWEDILARIRLKNREVPIILLTEDLNTARKAEMRLTGIQRFIVKDTLRFCGQILYKCIHGFSLQKYYKVESKTLNKIDENITGLKSFQAFWQESQEVQDPVCREVLDQVNATLSYLDSIQKKLSNTEESQIN